MQAFIVNINVNILTKVKIKTLWCFNSKLLIRASTSIDQIINILGVTMLITQRSKML